MLSDICEIYDGPHATPKKVEAGPWYLSISSLDSGRLNLNESAHISEADFPKWTRRVVPSHNDLVFSYETRLGDAALIPEGLHCALGRRMGLIRVDRNFVDPKFFLYMYLGPRFQEVLRKNTVQGATVDRILLTEMGSFPVQLPRLEDQKAIANILGTLDDKIELNRRMNETLESIARAIFKSWFVDFDPVRAKLEGQSHEQLSSASAYPMPAEVYDLFPSAFQDSELGKIPEGWEVTPVSSAFDINPKRLLKKGVEAKYLDMKNVPTSGHRPDQVAIREFKSGTKFENGDTLLARITPCLENGKTAFVDFLDKGEIAGGSTEFIVIRPKDPLPDELGYLLARDELFRAHAIQNMVGTSGRQRVLVDCFDHYDIVIPDAAVAVEFGEIVRPLFSKIKAATCLLYTSPSPRDQRGSRMPSSA